MSAELLRKAATILRERAEAATPGPWGCTSERRPRYIKTASPIVVDEADWGPDVGDQFQVVTASDSRAWRYADVAYIATMHPGVGLALADWLDLAARHAQLREDDGAPPHAAHTRALTLARLIVGEDR